MANKNIPDIQLFTLAEVSDALGITTRSLKTYIKNGQLRAVKLAGKWRISSDNLRAFVNGDTVPATTEPVTEGSGNHD